MPDGYHFTIRYDHSNFSDCRCHQCVTDRHTAARALERLFREEQKLKAARDQETLLELFKED